MRDSKLAELAQPTLGERESLADLLRDKSAYETFDAGKVAQRSGHAQAGMRRRGIRPIELTPGADLEALVEEAVAGGADALAMAGGDGSQAVVAGIAAEHDLPYACIPAGTRNHFALDLGVDRDDVVGALDAFVDGGERRVDLGCVNERIFVNNVSLGLYAESVQRDGYRDAKLRTILDTVPDVIGTDAQPRLDLQWKGPHGGEHDSATVILVSNNVYVLTGLVGAGTRPSIDDGLLGITVIGEAPAIRSDEPGESAAPALLQPPWRQWSDRTFEVESGDEVPAGIDGEAVTLTSPVRFRALPGVLRVRIAPQHPGASPSAALPSGAYDTVRTLLRIAAGRH